MCSISGIARIKIDRLNFLVSLAKIPLSGNAVQVTDLFTKKELARA
jgi:hypothetical protein